MAEGAEGKGFTKVIQKTVFRTKEKVLQNLGKADKTKDEEFTEHLNNFQHQQGAAVRVQKEMKNFMTHVKGMVEASRSMYRTMAETYESDWSGHEQLVRAAEELSDLAQDYCNKLTDQINPPLQAYVTNFSEVKTKIAKRERKLTDYDIARHNLQSLERAKNSDSLKTAKARDQLETSKRIYDDINTSLCSDLPKLYKSRIHVLGSFYQQLIAADAFYQSESSKVKTSLADTLDKSREQNGEEFDFYKASRSPLTSASSIDRYDKRSSQLSDTSTHSDMNDYRYPQQMYDPDYETVEEKKPNKSNEVTRIGEPSNPQHKPESETEQLFVRKNEDLQEKMERDRLQSATTTAVEAAAATTTTTTITTTTHTTTTTAATARESDDSDSVHLANEVAVHSEEPSDDEDNLKVEQHNDVDEQRTRKTSSASETPSATVIQSKPNNTHAFLYKVEALHNYQAEDDDELSLDKGDILGVIDYDNPDDQEEGWLMGIKLETGKKGIFPENFTKRI